jgi:hypothetical protein
MNEQELYAVIENFKGNESASVSQITLLNKIRAFLDKNGVQSQVLEDDNPLIDSLSLGDIYPYCDAYLLITLSNTAQYVAYYVEDAKELSLILEKCN